MEKDCIIHAFTFSLLSVAIIYMECDALPGKLLDRFKREFEVKTTGEQRVGACSLARNTLGVEGCAGVTRWD